MMQIPVVVVVLLQLFFAKITLLHALPSIEACPSDSVLIEDTCKCNHESCLKPPCLSELVLSVNGTDEPGKCCPIYTCQGCNNETRIHGQCPCAPGAILNSDNKCKCFDLYKTLVNNECICDSDLCELPQLCDEKSVLVTYKDKDDDCCSKTKCIKCPDDSFPTTNSDSEQVEDKCVCYPCHNQCGPNETTSVLQRGSGFPGRCCDLYKCVSKSVEKKCLAGDTEYGEGETWRSRPDGQECKCQNGISLCSKPTNEESRRPCHSEGKMYDHNESWMMDSCTNCTCFDGDFKCIAHMCEVHEGQVNKPECQPLKCNKMCSDGYKLNKRGCKICKCNYSTRCDDILHKYNVSRSELETILEKHFLQVQLDGPSSILASTMPASTTDDVGEDGAVDVTTPPNAAGSDKQSTTVVMPSNDTMITWPIIFVIVFAVLFAIAILYLIVRVFRKHGNKGSYDTAPTSALQHTYERVKSKQEALISNYISNMSNRDSMLRN